MNELTRTLVAVSAGQSASSDDLLPLVYQELRWLAAAMMAKEPLGQTLQPTALVHEAWLRLVNPEAQKIWQTREHFFRTAARAMRRIIVDRARSKKAAIHGGNLEREDIQEVKLASPQDDELILAVDEALEELARAHPETATVVELKFFAGMTREEIAALLNISVKEVDKRWNYARHWLQVEMGKDGTFKRRFPPEAPQSS